MQCVEGHAMKRLVRYDDQVRSLELVADRAQEFLVELLQMGSRSVKEPGLNPPHVARIKTEFRDLKLEHAQRMFDPRGTRDSGDFQAILGYDRGQNAVANAKVFDQSSFWSQDFTKAMQGYGLGNLDAGQLRFRGIDFSDSLEKFLLILLGESPKCTEPFVGGGQLSQFVDFDPMVVPVQLLSKTTEFACTVLFTMVASGRTRLASDQ